MDPLTSKQKGDLKCSKSWIFFHLVESMGPYEWDQGGNYFNLRLLAICITLVKVHVHCIQIICWTENGDRGSKSSCCFFKFKNNINSPIIDGVIVFQYKAQYCRSIITVMQSIDLVSMPHQINVIARNQKLLLILLLEIQVHFVASQGICKKFFSPIG